MSHPLRGTFVGNAIVRLADEGVPIGALSRTFKIPYDSAHGIVRQALTDGVIVEMPAADWPTASRRGFRSPTTAPVRLDDRPDFLMTCKALFGLTPAEGRLLHCLLQAPACTKPHLHAVIAPEAEPKIIDVFVCKIRAKLRTFQVRIDTIWGQGYAMPEESKRQLRARIGGAP
ncbi:MAG: winged helix family transcriptional regulator [Proteobacteria bacterium]|nr:winged helix family transcriptional regulator [Pseudomonadota bacterium]